MSSLDVLLEIVEASAQQALKRGFVANVMTTGTDEYKAVECGLKIGNKIRAEIIKTISDKPKEGECGSGSCKCLA